VTRIRASALSVLGGCSLLLLASCAMDSSEDGASAPVGVLPPHPWVQGGQTGALMPPCGLTPAALAGDSIPGGDTGIVVHTESCVGFVAAELELRDGDGNPVEFDLESLPGGAVLLRPRTPLSAGVYRVKVAGMEMESVVAEAPPALPMRLGTLQVLSAPKCGVDIALDVDPLLVPYLPQLKLSISVDGGAEQVWFDYGTLEVTDGRAQLSLPSCSAQPCLTDGVHSLFVTAELAGELGTLEPVEVSVETRCNVSAAGSAPAGSGDGSGEGDGADEGMDCGVARVHARKPAGERALQSLLAVLGLLAWRRARRSSA
jgi:hypothetical protein